MRALVGTQDPTPWGQQLLKLYGAMLLVIVASIGYWLHLTESDHPSDPSSLEVRQAKFLYLSQYRDSPPELGLNHASTVQLPHRMDQPGRVGAGFAWYIFDIEVNTSDQFEALYLPRVGMNAEVYVDGQRVSYFGPMLGAYAERNWNQPLIVHNIAAFSKPGKHQVAIQVRVFQHYLSGLSSVWLGTNENLREAHDSRTFHQVNLLAGSTALMFGAALVLSIVSIFPQTRRPLLGWLILACLLWGIRNFSFIVATPPVHYRHWIPIVQGCMLAFFMVLFHLILNHCNQVPRRIERWILNASAASLPLLFLGPLEWVMLFIQVLGTIGMAGSVWAVRLLVQRGNALRSLSDHVFAIGLLTLFISSLNDLLLVSNVLPFDWYFLNQQLGGVGFLALAYFIGGDYAKMIREGHHFNRKLKRQLDDQERMLAEKHQALQQTETQKVQMAERQRLMADMHDGIGAHLVAAIHQLRNPQANRERVLTTLEEGLRDLQLTIDSLEPIENDLGVLVGAFRYRIAPSLTAANIQIHWDVQRNLPKLTQLTPRTGLMVLRILQELFTNVLKHSKATTVRFSLWHWGNEIHLSVEDNGCGFDTDLQQHGKGLRNLVQRAEQLQGRLNIRSQVGQGTIVTLTLPADTTP